MTSISTNQAKLIDDKYRVEFNGDVTYINGRLVERQGITDEGLGVIKELHKLKIDIFQQARKASDVAEIRRLAAEYEQLEFRLQAAWGFSVNVDYHRWFDFPRCSCPKFDNEDRYGTPYRIYNQDCIVHGGGEGD